MAKAKSAAMGMDKSWQAQHDLQTLIEAEKIKNDKGRLKACMNCKREMEKALKNV